METYLWLALLGFGIGAYGTLIGAGGGFILMPVLILLYPDAPTEVLTSISLAVVFVNTSSGSAAYARMKRIDYRSGIPFAIATLPGAILGAFTTEHIPRQPFNMGFGVVMILASCFLWYRPAPGLKPSSVPRAGNVSYELVDAEGIHHQLSYNRGVGLVLSFFVGFVSSVLGIGGGIVHVPALVHFLGFPVHISTATSHFILAIMALAHTAVQAAKGTFADVWMNTLVLSVGALLGAQLGARLSGRVNAVWIIRGLAIALLISGGRILWKAVDPS